MIPELANGTSHGLPIRVNKCYAYAQTFCGLCPRNELQASINAVHSNERELGMFCAFALYDSRLRIGVEDAFGKSGKQQIEDKASQKRLVKSIHGRVPGPEVCRACDIAIF
jgi:hypothetical protein